MKNNLASKMDPYSDVPTEFKSEVKKKQSDFGSDRIKNPNVLLCGFG